MHAQQVDLEPEASSQAVFGIQSGSLQPVAGSSAVMPSVPASLPRTAPKRPAAIQVALPFQPAQQQGAFDPKPAKKAKQVASAPGKQKCRACFAYDWFQKTRANGGTFADLADIAPIYLSGSGHKKICPNGEGFATVMGQNGSKGPHPSFPGWGPQHQRYFCENENGKKQH